MPGVKEQADKDAVTTALAHASDADTKFVSVLTTLSAGEGADTANINDHGHVAAKSPKVLPKWRAIMAATGAKRLSALDRMQARFGGCM